MPRTVVVADSLPGYERIGRETSKFDELVSALIASERITPPPCNHRRFASAATARLPDLTRMPLHHRVVERIVTVSGTRMGTWLT